MTNNSDAPKHAGPPQTQPIRELVIRKERLRNGDHELVVRIDHRGQLALHGSDSGKFVSEVWGADDYDFEQAAQAEFRDTVLLHLMAERFSKTSDFRAWCDARGIPTQFCAWP